MNNQNCRIVLLGMCFLMSVALGSDVNLSVQDYRFALQKAIVSNRLDQVRHVLQQGVNPNSLDCHGSTALIQAIKNNRSNIVEFLLDFGVDPNIPGDFGHTALMEAARNGSVEIVRMLIESKANINAQDRKFKSTSLMWAVGSERESVVRCLLEAGADLELLNNQGRAVVALAEKYCRNKNILKILELAPLFKNLAVEYNSFESEPSPENYIEDVCMLVGSSGKAVMFGLSDDNVHEKLKTQIATFEQDHETYWREQLQKVWLQYLEGGRTGSDLKPVRDLVLKNVALMPQVASCFKNRDVFINFLEELMSSQSVETEESKQLARIVFIERSICQGAKTMKDMNF